MASYFIVPPIILWLNLIKVSIRIRYEVFVVLWRAVENWIYSAVASFSTHSCDYCVPKLKSPDDLSLCHLEFLCLSP